MNWNKLKEKYPKAYPEIKAFSEKTEIADAYELMSKFLNSKGFYSSITWIRALRDYEESLTEKIQDSSQQKLF